MRGRLLTLLFLLSGLFGCNRSNTVETNIEELRVGAAGWTAPWNLNSDDEGRLWISPGSKILQHKDSTANVLVRRNRYGLVVDIALTRYMWPKHGERGNPNLQVVRLDDGTERAVRLDSKLDSTQARLPNHKRQLQMRDLLPGQSAYTAPWAMFADAAGKLWVDSEYAIQDRAVGIASMSVTREELGYRCDVSRCGDFRWRVGGGASYVETRHGSPVSELVGHSNGDAQATLPGHLREQLLRHLTVGQSAWTIPEAMFADAAGNLWVDEIYEIYPKPNETATMLVKRFADGFTCDLSKCRKSQWPRKTVSEPLTHKGVPVILLVGYTGNGRQAELPDSLRERVLLDLKPGESCWTLPWALYCAEDGTFKLNGDYEQYSLPVGAVDMKVTRTSTGYKCDVSSSRLNRAWNKPGKPEFAGDFTPLEAESVITN